MTSESSPPLISSILLFYERTNLRPVLMVWYCHYFTKFEQFFFINGFKHTLSFSTHMTYIEINSMRCVTTYSNIYSKISQTIRTSNNSAHALYLYSFNDYELFACFWRNIPQWARASSFLRFLDHIQRRTTIGRNSLDE